jgi:hypothetical protein
MSFKCQSCNKQQKVKVKPTKVVSKKRKTYYPEVRNRDNEIVCSSAHGWEIVQELDCCAKCAPRIEANAEFVKAN